MSELIELKQAPVIEYSKLDQIAEEVKERLSLYKFDELVVNEETVKDIKNLRTALTKEKEELESARKQIKKLVNEPYDLFEKEYKDKILSLYQNSDIKLKTAIDEVENRMKQEKENEVREYFQELLLASKIDFVTFDKVGLNITLSASLKSLKEQAKEFVDKVDDDLKLISTQDFAERVLIKYKKTLNVSNSIIETNSEVKQEQELLHANELAQKVKEAEKKQEPMQDQPLTTPEEILTISFKVTGTRNEIVSVREFIKEKGIKYE